MEYLTIEKLSGKSVGKMKIEFIERKGKGHPDHIIDSLCEAVSQRLSKYYIKEYGRILHHNIDKGLLVGGEASPKFGGGSIIKPIEVYIAGRATIPDDNYEVIDREAFEAIVENINLNFRFLNPIRHMKIKTILRKGAVELQELVHGNEPLANDTSFGVSYAPFSDAERITLGIEEYLNSESIKKEYPYVGEDIKIMTLRRGKNIDITVAAAFIDKFIENLNDYKRKKEELLELIKEYVSENMSGYRYKIYLNTADDYEKGNIYLTVTGTSAEMGDDGNTGRGNRVNGLITPNRLMSLEATAGKNPVSHVGKIYNVMAYYLSNKIYEQLQDYIEEVYVRILSRIGVKITEPQVTYSI
jgi:S-adenosylmethionine synthetase